MSLETIGRLAVELHSATQARKSAKRALKAIYNEYSGGKIIAQGHELYEEMQRFAAPEIKAYARAKLTEYNLQRKLDRAVSRYVGNTKLAQLVGGEE